MFSALEKSIQDKFSQSWEVYRVATHELGGLHLIKQMSQTYSTKDLYDMLEILDVHDSLKKAAHEKAEIEAKQNKK